MRKTMKERHDPTASTLRRLRMSLGMTVQQVATEAEMTPSTVSRIETGAHGPSLQSARVLAAIYGITMDDFVTLSEAQRKIYKQSITPGA